MAWRPLGLVVFLTLAACSSPDDPPQVPSDPALPGGGGSNTGDPGSGNPGASDAGTSDAGTGTPSDGGIPNNDAGIPNNDAGIPNNDAGIPNNDAGFAASLSPEDRVLEGQEHVDTDLDGNGTVDARCLYTRDARGTLVREECFRLPVDPAHAPSADGRDDGQ